MSERNNFEIRLKSAEQYGQTLQRQYDCSSANVVSPAEIIDVQSKSPDEELLELKLTNQELNREMEELKIQRKEIKRRVDHTRIQLEKLEEQVDSIPQQDRQSADDLKVQISQLKKEKQCLEQRQQFMPTQDLQMKKRIQADLDRLSNDLHDARDEQKKYKLQYQREEAKIAALKQQVAVLAQRQRPAVYKSQVETPQYTNS